MPKPSKMAGTSVQGRYPEWQPLRDLVGPYLADWFMWMYEIQLTDGTRVHAYKHIDTRQYLHLSEDGRAFFFEPSKWYRRVERGYAVSVVLSYWFRSCHHVDRIDEEARHHDVTMARLDDLRGIDDDLYPDDDPVVTDEALMDSD